jgi:hypothetical protein
MPRASATSPLEGGRLLYMLGRDDEYTSALERAHQLHVDDGELLRTNRNVPPAS